MVSASQRTQRKTAQNNTAAPAASASAAKARSTPKSKRAISQAASAEKDASSLCQLALDMREKAYCPHSRFRVGAALECNDGTVFTGCNVENSSYGLTICAERTAIVKAVSEGHRQFKRIAVAADVPDEFTYPCGACRQFLAEFGLGIEVVLVKPNKTQSSVLLGELLPHAFTPEDLHNGQNK